jgi:hypothetical protein
MTALLLVGAYFPGKIYSVIDRKEKMQKLQQLHHHEKAD